MGLYEIEMKLNLPGQANDFICGLAHNCDNNLMDVQVFG